MKEKHGEIKAILISGIGILLGYLINFFLTPYITSNIGVEEYGFVSIAKNCVSYASIITVALTAYMVRFISIPYHKNELHQAQAYYSSSVAAITIVATTIFVLMLPVIFYLDHFLKIPGELSVSVRVLFVEVFLGFVFTAVAVPFTASAYIKKRMDLNGYVKILAYLCEAAVLFVIFSAFEPDVYFVGIGTIVTTGVTLAADWAIKRKLTPLLRYDKSLVSLSKIKELVGSGIWSSLNSLGNILNSGLDLLISNLMLTAGQTGELGIVKMIGTMFVTLQQVVFTPIQARLLKAYATKDKNVVVDEITKSMKLCGCISNIAIAGFIALGELYYRLWLPDQNGHLLYVLTVINISSCITEGAIYPVYYVNTLTLKNRLPCWVTIASGLVNVGAMYLMLRYTNWGLYAVVSTTAIIMIGINLLFNPQYSARCLQVKATPFYKALFSHVCSLGAMVVLFSMLNKLLRPQSWVGLLGCAVVMVPVGIITHMFFVGEIKRMHVHKGD